MRADRILDLVRWGNNIAARAIGDVAVAYRPQNACGPLKPEHRYLRLPVMFTSVRGRFEHPTLYGDALRIGIYDASYTRPGDYLVLDAETWFIASQDRFLPSLCVETNRLISVARPGQALAVGAIAYAGITTGTTVTVADDWPASVLGISDSGANTADLPTDLSVPYWTVLLPVIPNVTLKVSDLITDDLGRTGVIVAAESTRLGWRLTVKETTT